MFDCFTTFNLCLPQPVSVVSPATEYEADFVWLLDKLTNGSIIEVNETGIKFSKSYITFHFHMIT